MSSASMDEPPLLTIDRVKKVYIYYVIETNFYVELETKQQKLIF